MGIDLSQFHQVFFEESIEGLDVMESALMELDPSNIDSETINLIFRSAHSIKGGSATFGFTSISDFTHDLETILDQVRSGIRGVTSEDVNLYLQSVDCMREMLSLLQDGKDGLTELSDKLKNEFKLMLERKTSGESSDTALVAVETKPDVQADVKIESKATDPFIWKVSFVPSINILQTGNDPHRIIRELAEIGEFIEVNCTSELPNLSGMDPSECYLKWEIILSSYQDKEDIYEPFEWVIDESQIDIEPYSSGVNWHIHFEPNAEILQTGNEPTRLFRVLEGMGELEVKVGMDKLPNLASMDAEVCYLYWDLYLKSNTADEDSIREIFEWVIEDSLFEISSNEKVALDVENINEDLKPATVDAKAPENEEKVDTVKEPDAKNQEEDKVKPNLITSAPKKIVAETSSIRVGTDKVDNLINMVGELVITQSMLGQLGSEFDLDRLPKLIEGLNQLEQNTRELQESVMQIRMLPISFAFSRFPRMARDLSQSLNKKIELKMIGEQTELDKTVMEKIGDPLVHLVRNALDHGIEIPEERIKKGKPETGTVILDAYHQGGNVVIEIRDDGKGLDKDKIIAKAIEKGIITESDSSKFSKEQAFDLIFQPGFSTAAVVSDVSGRGVGMDVVKRNIQALNGVVELTSEKDKGSKVTIRLPLTLAILDGQLVRVGNNTYIFPLVSIVESLQCKSKFVSNIAGGCNVFRLRDDYVPIVELHKTFSIEVKERDVDENLMVVVESDGEKVGLIVDELLAQQQVVIKSLEQNYRRVEGISGATILGDGTVALILDIPGIVKLSGEGYKKAQEFSQISMERQPHTLDNSIQATG